MVLENDTNSGERKYGRRSILKKAGVAGPVGLGGVSLHSRRAKADGIIVEESQKRKVKLGDCDLIYAPDNIDHYAVGADIVLGEGATAASRSTMATAIGGVFGGLYSGALAKALAAIGGIFGDGLMAEGMGQNDTVFCAAYDTHKTVYVDNPIGWGSIPVDVPVVRAGIHYYPNVNGLPDSTIDLDDDDFVELAIVTNTLVDYLDIIIDVPHDIPDVPGHLDLSPQI